MNNLTQKTLEDLKKFQRNTVEHVIERMFSELEPASRFLIADEVGLGKTIVARGIIAKLCEKRKEKLTKILYICSNQQIAAQNLEKLNILDTKLQETRERITLLPFSIATSMNDNSNRTKNLEYICFSPGTSLNLDGSGLAKERAAIIALLQNDKGIKKYRKGFNRLLYARASEESINKLVIDRENEIKDSVFLQKFRDELIHELKKRAPITPTTSRRSNFYDEIIYFASCFSRTTSNPSNDIRSSINKIISRLRYSCAEVIVEQINADLIILDEFQRFRDLLKNEDELDQANEAQQLASAIFKNPNTKILLLSATPFKMYTTHQEQENHYQDFHSLMKFVSKNNNYVDILRIKHEEYQDTIKADNIDYGHLKKMTLEISKHLTQYMIRTERVSIDKSLNSMVVTKKIIADSFTIEDLQQLHLYNEVAVQISKKSPVRVNLDIWKSAPYTLNFMKDQYAIKRYLKGSDHELSDSICNKLREETSVFFLNKIDKTKKIPIPNGRLRSLCKLVFDENSLHKFLWIPPSFPYWPLAKTFAESSNSKNGTSKILIFSNWHVVPESVTAILNHNSSSMVYRRPIKDNGRKKTLLHRLTLQSYTLLGLPSTYLASLWNSQEIIGTTGHLLNMSGLVFDLERKIRKQLEIAIPEFNKIPHSSANFSINNDWYLYALFALDEHIIDYLNGASTELNFNLGKVKDHVNKILNTSISKLGPVPKDLALILAKVAIASPGTCALRSFLSINSLKESENDCFNAALKIGYAFRRYLNNLTNINILCSIYDDIPGIWRKVLEYSQDTCLQAVLDEYIWLLSSDVGKKNTAYKDLVKDVAESVSNALTKIKSHSITIDLLKESKSSKNKTKRKLKRPLSIKKIKGRFAMRFANSEADLDSSSPDDMRKAFNSPFKPHILTTTSIGQEGLDFHSYCRLLVHWNLPHNPVDLEQREGRIHRYLNLAIRQNIAKAFVNLDTIGTSQLQTIQEKSLWDFIIETIQKRFCSDGSELKPFWIFEDGISKIECISKIERILLLLPCSKESGYVGELLKKVALYRLAFGQPRQDDLMEYLINKDEQEILKLQECAINLLPADYNIEK